MINFLSKWIEGIALAVIITSIFEMILPEGNIKKYIKVILGIYIIFSIVSPFVNSKELYNLNIENTIETYSNNIKTENNNPIDMEKIYTTTFENQIKQSLEKKGYNIQKCIVEGVFDANKKDAGIKKVEIILASKKDEVTSNIKTIEKVEINIEENKKEKEISQKEIKELKKYLSEYFEIEKDIIDIR